MLKKSYDKTVWPSLAALKGLSSVNVFPWLKCKSETIWTKYNVNTVQQRQTNDCVHCTFQVQMTSR